MGYRSVAGGVTRCECRRRKIVAAKMASIPERFRNASFENYVPMDAKQEAALDRISKDFTGSYFLSGIYGRGKTHLATAQFVRFVHIERPCLFVTMAELIGELRRAEMDSDYFCEVRQRVRYADQFHLFIDDVDKFKGSDFRFEILFDLIDGVYRRNLGLTITSNYNLRELVEAESLHPSIVRRIDDICQVVEV